jgi:hypothetical protein
MTRSLVIELPTAANDDALSCRAAATAGKVRVRTPTTGSNVFHTAAAPRDKEIYKISDAKVRRKGEARR